MKISVIIPSRNEAKYIEKTLKALKDQSFKDFEVIVVDSSDDETPKIAEKYAKVVFEKRKGVAIARNKGAKLAKGEILLFLDADTIPSKNLLKVYSKIFEDKKVVAATGPVKPISNSTFYKIGYWFVSDFFVRVCFLFKKNIIMGMNFAVRKKVFEKEKGFNEKFVTFEDWDLALRLRKHGKILFSKEAFVYSSERRVKKWGVLRFVIFHVGNIIRYILFKKPKTKYEEVR
ncbi:MAG: glycosyltransferase [Candidatus Micrarchaeia archaeon]